MTLTFLRFFKQSHCCGSGTEYLYKFNSKKSVSLAANVANVAKFFIFKKLQERGILKMSVAFFNLVQARENVDCNHKISTHKNVF